jgi:hypothetical protein
MNLLLEHLITAGILYGSVLPKARKFAAENPDASYGIPCGLCRPDSLLCLTPSIFAETLALYLRGVPFDLAMRYQFALKSFTVAIFFWFVA